MPIEMIKFKFIKVLSYLPVLFLVALGFGFLLFRVFPDRIFASGNVAIAFGVIFFLVGTVLVLFSEKARHTMFDRANTLTCQDFESGVYKYGRHPGVLGFLILLFGFGFFLNSMAIIVTGILHFILLSLVFIPLIEREIIKFCGDSYQDYKHAVRMWL